MGDDPTTHLREMGLSEYESKVYDALLRCGTTTARAVSDASGVPQSRVYDVLDSLVEKGFAHVQPGRPKKYGPIDPDAAVQQFCDYRRRQHSRDLASVREHGERLQHAVDDRDRPRADAGGVDVAWSHSDRHQILERLATLCEAVEDRVLLITTPLSFERVVNHHTDVLRRKTDDGVTVRALVADHRPIDEAVRRRASEWMEIRRVDAIHGRLYLYDDSHVVLAFRDTDDDGYVGVSTASPHLYRTLSHLFELMWADGEPLATRA